MAEVQIPENIGTMLPSNSMKDKERKAQVTAVSMKGKIKKKSSFAELFLSEDRADVGSYVLKDIVIPMIKETVFDAAMGALSMTLFGGRVTNHRGYRPMTNSKISYNGMSNNNNTRNQTPANSAIRRSDLDISNITFTDKEDADKIHMSMTDLAQTYGRVTVADFYALLPPELAVDYDFTLGRWGWDQDDIMKSKVMPTRGAWYIDIVKANAIA